jgi:hypothetical protein
MARRAAPAAPLLSSNAQPPAADARPNSYFDPAA